MVICDLGQGKDRLSSASAAGSGAWPAGMDAGRVGGTDRAHADGFRYRGSMRDIRSTISRPGRPALGDGAGVVRSRFRPLLNRGSTGGPPTVLAHSRPGYVKPSELRKAPRSRIADAALLTPCVIAFPIGRALRVAISPRDPASAAVVGPAGHDRSDRRRQDQLPVLGTRMNGGGRSERGARPMRGRQLLIRGRSGA